MAGQTFSSNFPTTPTAFDPVHNSPDDWFDGFVLQMFTPSYCTVLGGAAGPDLSIDKAVGGACPSAPPDGTLVDLIEGHLDQIGPDDLGDVTAIACDSFRLVYGHDSTPAPGAVLFQLARYAGGSYIDGALPGLVGSRIPASGDCP